MTAGHCQSVSLNKRALFSLEVLGVPAPVLALNPEIAGLRRDDGDHSDAQGNHRYLAKRAPQEVDPIEWS